MLIRTVLVHVYDKYSINYCKILGALWQEPLISKNLMRKRCIPVESNIAEQPARHVAREEAQGIAAAQELLEAGESLRPEVEQQLFQVAEHTRDALQSATFSCTRRRHWHC